MFAGQASGQEELADLEARMETIQAELDAAAERIRHLHAFKETVHDRLNAIEQERHDVEKRYRELAADAAARATELYMDGNQELVEALFSADDFAELTTNMETLSQLTMENNTVFMEARRARDHLAYLEEEMSKAVAEKSKAEAELKKEADALQAKLRSVSGKYEVLKARLNAPAGVPVATGTAVYKAKDGMYCPVAGPTSFVDSWGDPRSGGRAHEGVDMMGAYGTPQVAIVSGTITYAAYSSLGGNVQYLQGDDGNLYVYIHQASHTVTSGRVKAGQQISVLGDTGNAAGNPHLHFEFHPGGGGPVNPYPLVASLC